MLEMYEINRPSFNQIKNAIPDYKAVQEYFYEFGADLNVRE